MDRLKSEFISTAAHELRTPLTSIQGFSEILLTRDLNEERQTRYLNFINQQASALAAIIEDLLDLSRLEAKQSFKIADELVNLKEIVEQTIFGFRENNPDHSYHITGPEIWPSIQGDPAKLAQLFKNLFSNATKYSPDGGDVKLKATVESEYSLFHVALTDQGVGMTSEQLDHIFDRFYRADASNTAIGGTGLGMTISRLIVEGHSGKIWVESEYGSGTTVHILLPLPNRPDHILVIEDDDVLREVQQRSLELQGFTVLVAPEGKTGLQLSRAGLPNLILLDLALPGMTGFTVLEKLQADDLTQSIPVIITSAMDKPEDIERAIAQGVIDYLVKPYSMHDLIVRVNRALAEARREMWSST
jgi:CheY-like chemotaxis protein